MIVAKVTGSPCIATHLAFHSMKEQKGDWLSTNYLTHSTNLPSEDRVDDEVQSQEKQLSEVDITAVFGIVNNRRSL